MCGRTSEAFTQEKYNNDPVRIERALRNERFQVPETCTFDYLFENRNAANVGELINTALESMEYADPASWKGCSVTSTSTQKLTWAKPKTETED